MNRRDFLKYSSLVAAPLLIKTIYGWENQKEQTPFTVETKSDAKIGHIVRESFSYTQLPQEKTDFLIVGGGIAGLSAAYQLRDTDFQLYELSDRLGGSASYDSYKDAFFTTGAHYDPAYPDYYGQDALKALQELKVIGKNTSNGLYGFVDREFIIPTERESRCYENGAIREEVLPEEHPNTTDLLQLIQKYVGKMPMPIRLVDDELWGLNKLTFEAFLKQEISDLDTEWLRYVDYAMLDDYGGTSKEVSALAGIHYYACRPYYSQKVETLSAPEGNYYFAQKMISQIPQERLSIDHLIRSIHDDNGTLLVDVVDVKNKTQRTIQADKVIYAGQKHAVKYIYAQDAHLFAQNKSTPWLIANVIFKENTVFKNPAFWQNDMVTDQHSFLGFVDSKSQSGTTRRNFTCYYCFAPDQRAELQTWTEDKATMRKMANQTIAHLSTYFGEDVTDLVEHVQFKARGHAMPIPVPNYCQKEPLLSTHPNIAYAGVDTGRLPLFFEALDSGIQAVKVLDDKG